MKSAAFFVPALGLMVLLAVGAVAAALYLLQLGPPPGLSGWLTIGLCFLVGLAPLAMWSSANTYLVPGGRGELRLFPDRVEVWSAGEGTKLFPFDALSVHVTRHITRYRVALIPLASVNTDNHLTLRAGDQQVVLSQKLFEQPDAVAHIAQTIDRMRRGESPTAQDPGSPPSPTAAPSAPRDEYDDLLDRELEAMD